MLRAVKVEGGEHDPPARGEREQIADVAPGLPSSVPAHGQHSARTIMLLDVTLARLRKQKRSVQLGLFVDVQLGITATMEAHRKCMRPHGTRHGGCATLTGSLVRSIRPSTDMHTPSSSGYSSATRCAYTSCSSGVGQYTCAWRHDLSTVNNMHFPKNRYWDTLPGVSPNI